jgi:hypothetical protein
MQSRWALGFFLLVGCGAPATQGGDDSGVQGNDAAGQDADAGTPFGDSGTSDAGTCDPPDMLVVLDRSDSMNKPPDGADGGASKWSLAVAALDDITAAPIDGTLRFGLELLPDQDLSKGDAGTCGSGLLSIDTALGNGASIASTLAKAQLDNGTPIGGALDLARTTLANEVVSGRGQNVLLVTDGKETCDGAPPLPVVQKLAAAKVSTYVVGFGGAVDASMLNDLACAGLTAKDFATSCKKTPGGYVANVPNTTHVYFDAASGDDLKTALAAIASGTCCGCIVN